MFCYSYNCYVNIWTCCENILNSIIIVLVIVSCIHDRICERGLIAFPDFQVLQVISSYVFHILSWNFAQE